MKILSLVHGLPPENAGGTESSALASAEALAAAGHRVVLVAGSLRTVREVLDGEGEPRSEIDRGTALLRETHGAPARTGLRVLRLHRSDLHFDHWHKSRDAGVRSVLRALLREERPDVLHVHHWLRATTDVVALARSLGIPSVVSLHDAFVACPAQLRLRLPDGNACEARVDVEPCLACVSHLAPATPFVDVARGTRALERRQGDLMRELSWAGALVVPSSSHGEALGRWLGAEVVQGLRFECLSPRVEPLPWRPVPVLPGPLEHGTLVLGCFGTLSREKGVDRVIRAVAGLEGDPALPGVRLEVAGAEPDAAYARELRDLAQGLGVGFHGSYRADDLAEHPVARVHAFVSGTRAHESHGLVLDEARSLGLPHVLPARGAFVERGGEGRGGLLFGRDGVELEDCLRRLVLEPGLLDQLRRETRELHRRDEGFGVARHVEPLEAIYRRVMASAVGKAPDGPSFEDAADLRWTRDWDAALSAGRQSGGGDPPMGEGCDPR